MTWGRYLALAAAMLPVPALAQQAVYQQIPANPPAVVVGQELNFPCWYCLAIDSQGGGRAGATSAIFDLHVISSATDAAFPRALVARMDAACAVCQPTAITAQVRGSNPLGTVFGANLEAYSVGRAAVVEINMGAALGGYVLDVVPVRMPDGAPSRIDAVLKVEGAGGDSAAAVVGAVVEVKINPQRAVIVIPADQGPVTVMETADGRMKEVWAKDDAGKWSRQIIIDGVPVP